MENQIHNAFRKLFQIPVTEYVEKKGQFSYLSWPFAVAQLRLADPSATWEVRRFDGLPYLQTDAGVFVEVAVSVQGITLSQIHPVLDGRNQPILAPSAFEINTSLQRCLVKAIALHGLGLNIYAGEDLPDLLKDTAGGVSTLSQSRVRHLPTKAKSPAGEIPLTPAQFRYLQRLIADTEADEQALLNEFGLERLESVPKNRVNDLIQALDTMRRAA